MYASNNRTYPGAINAYIVGYVDSSGKESLVVTPSTAPVNREGITSSTVNTWTLLMPANSKRSRWSFQNISDTAMNLGMKDASDNIFPFVTLDEGETAGEVDTPLLFALYVRCSAASKIYYAFEI
jgi:hypothetical protein